MSQIGFSEDSLDDARIFSGDGIGLYDSVLTRLLTLSEAHIFSPRALNTFQFSVNRVKPEDYATLRPRSARKTWSQRKVGCRLFGTQEANPEIRA
jgi:hypothetical protein